MRLTRWSAIRRPFQCQVSFLLYVAFLILCNAVLESAAADYHIAGSPQDSHVIHSVPVTSISDQSDSKTEVETTRHRERLARATRCTIIKAPREFVWSVLTDFPNHPKIFHRTKSCRVIKRDGNLLYIEVYLKPGLFVSKECQHTVTDISGAPGLLTWHMLDGNFKSVHGRWELESIKDGKFCKATYTLEVDPGPIIPAFLVSFALHEMQKEIVTSFSNGCESFYAKAHP